MGIQLAHYLAAGKNSPFYGVAKRAVDPVTVAEDRRLQENPVPAGWLVNSFGGWEAWTPRGWIPRLQGWKIHLSATPENAARVLTVATELCVERKVAFNFLPTVSELTSSSGKQAGRGGSGKFVTIYPDDDDVFAALLPLLAERLESEPGPYILSDLRYSDDAPVFVRYGGIAPLEMRDTRDQPVSCVAMGGAHTFVEDRRVPQFVLPDGVELPGVLADAWDRAQSEVHSRLDDFTDITALHFSNAGGVYRATLPDGSCRVLREARPHAGLDARGRCSQTRQRVEEEVLRDLNDVPGVQHLRGVFHAWEHRYLELDYVDGVTLTSWTVSNLRQQEHDPDVYAERVRTITARLVDVVDRIHARGWALGDVHGGNVLIGPDEEVTVLDLEDATRIGEPREVGFRVFEYCADLSVTAEQADWFAVARMIMLMYVADWEVEAAAPGYWQQAKEYVREHYGAESLAQIESVERRYPEGTTSMLATDDPVGVFDVVPVERDAIGRLASGIEWSRRYGRDGDYPGDVAGGDLRRYVLGSGRAGVELVKGRGGGKNSADDLDELERVAREWAPHDPPGLMTGLGGVALALSESGRTEASVKAAHSALDAAQGRHRLDWAEGLSGVSGVAMEVAEAAGDSGLLAQALEVLDRVDRTVSDWPSAHDDLMLQRGLFWGCTGLAMTHLIAHRFDPSPQRLERAVSLIREDVDSCTVDDSGALMVPDEVNGRIMPYLEWGSAGVWMAATIAERLTGADILTVSERDGFARACTSSFYIYPSLYHGRAGILAALAAADRHDEADEQSRLLRRSLFERAGHAFVIGDGLIRLSSDLATGSAGVMLALLAREAHNPYLVLPVSRATARHWQSAGRTSQESQAADVEAALAATH